MYDAKGHEYICYLNDEGLRHRIDGPAVIYADGREQYWVDGKLHRIGAPAIIEHHCVVYCKNGLQHREDGPSLIFNDGYEEFWIDGVQQPKN
jgi:hypothetical protein